MILQKMQAAAMAWGVRMAFWWIQVRHGGNLGHGGSYEIEDF